MQAQCATKKGVLARCKYGENEEERVGEEFEQGTVTVAAVL